MIESLYIENFAIIDQVQIDFKEGMTVLTGETGAGKSIIIDAIGQLLGQRTLPGYVKENTEQAFIEGVFTSNEEINRFLENNHYPTDNQLIVSKNISKDGKAAVKINYRSSSQMFLKELMNQLVDIHSQFETHQLFKTSYHLKLLDNYAGNELLVLKEEYTNIFKELKEVKDKYDSLVNEELSDEQLDFYISQRDEIEELDLDNFDEEKFLKERNELVDFEKNSNHINSYRNLMEGNNSIMKLFKDSLDELSYLNNDDIQVIYDKLYDLYYSIEGYNNDIYDIYNYRNFSQEHYDEIQDTYFKLNKLKRKYGQNIEAIIKFKDELDSKINYFNNRETIINDLKMQIDNLYNKSHLIALNISKVRKEKAIILEDKVKDILDELYLPNVSFKFNFNETDLTDNGLDSVSIVVSTNIGQTPKPLQKIASGGELSRIMLAIKTASNTESNTIIFDEADTGVSGKVAESIGKVMANIAKNQQVLCITHLAQVACFADNHLFISKASDDNNTSVKVKELNEDDSILELAKMISGKDVTEQSIAHAKELKNNIV